MKKIEVRKIPLSNIDLNGGAEDQQLPRGEKLFYKRPKEQHMPALAYKIAHATIRNRPSVAVRTDIQKSSKEFGRPSTQSTYIKTVPNFTKSLKSPCTRSYSSYFHSFFTKLEND